MSHLPDLPDEEVRDVMLHYKRGGPGIVEKSNQRRVDQFMISGIQALWFTECS